MKISISTKLFKVDKRKKYSILKYLLQHCTFNFSETTVHFAELTWITKKIVNAQIYCQCFHGDQKNHNPWIQTFWERLNTARHVRWRVNGKKLNKLWKHSFTYAMLNMHKPNFFSLIQFQQITKVMVCDVVSSEYPNLF